MTSSFQQHREKWRDCQSCLLNKCRNRVVMARGKLPSPILFIGEAPGESENVVGLPFVGPAGRLLDYPSVILPGDIPIQFAWSTIQHAINSGTVLRI